ncbi:ArsR family transcriptional regulator [Arthrobacter sp. Soil736]|uniref:ArsR/SmtB family transcription factor n=1 Tax=Arthrobacter sp. Soil736 TaxID=1736395 RepID=UPI0006F238EA|nr:metalloregulator ArsR/SmtB family transcription factor [Arthrobacter sp. Soil736]KRE64960.1 ArsR family transcriptional regulator [Arthrobacter sp. Soil736]
MGREAGVEDFADFRAPLYEVKANLFKGLAHPVRIRVLELLSAAPEVSVTELLAATGLEATNLSQHLSVLRRYHLVRGERRALQMFYTLAYPQVADLLSVARLLLNDMLNTTREQLESSEKTARASAAADSTR